MEKVKVTQEQADAIKTGIDKFGKDQFLFEFSKMLHEISPAKYTGSLSPLNGLSLPVLAKVLYGTYEVEPEFKVGDWVRYDNGITHGWKTNLIKRIEDHGYAKFSETSSMPLHSLVHATPEEIATEKERRWWAEHDRDVWEIKENDILINLKNGMTYPVVEVNYNGVKFMFENKFRFNIKDNYRVACFAEDRKDLKGDK